MSASSRRTPMILTLVIAFALPVSATSSAARGEPSFSTPLWRQAATTGREPAQPFAVPLPEDPPLRPEDASWVGMPLPTINSFSVNRTFVEYGGQLVIGGEHTSAGTTNSYRVVSWNGSNFVAMSKPPRNCYWLHVWNGQLLAGLDWSSSGGSFEKPTILRWNGATWDTLARSNGRVAVLATFNGDLVATGRFTSIQGVAANRVARFDGTTWQPMGTGFAAAGGAEAMVQHGADLFVGGDMTGGVLRWNGTTWAAAGSGLNSTVNSLATDGISLYAAGNFTKSGADSVPGVGRWNGSTWSRLGVGTNSSGRCVTIWNGLVVADQRDGLGSRISRWNGSNWSGLGDSLSTGPWRLGVMGTKLVALGYNFKLGSRQTAGAATYDGVSWTPVIEAWTPNMKGLSFTSWDATVWNDHLVVVGQFPSAGAGGSFTAARDVAAWDGGAWSALGPGLPTQPLYCSTFGGDLIASGWTSITGSENIVRWNGATWTGFSTGLGFYVYDATEYAGALHACGSFTATPQGSPLAHIARWDGSTWQPLGLGTDDIIEALAVFNGSLVSAGRFTTAGGAAASNIASWNGSTWGTLGSGLDGECLALDLWNGELVAGGTFQHAGGDPAPGAARWDGTQWRAMGDNATRVDQFAQLDGVLYAAGRFGHLDGTFSTTVARWTGTRWQPLGSGTPDGRIFWVHGYHGDLYAGGGFGYAFGQSSHNIIRLPNANTLDAPMPGGPGGRIALAASPNPGAGRTTLSFTLPNRGRARLSILDLAGRELTVLVDGPLEPGDHSVAWKSSCAPGIYFALLEAGGSRRSVRLVRVN